MYVLRQLTHRADRRSSPSTTSSRSDSSSASCSRGLPTDGRTLVLSAITHLAHQRHRVRPVVLGARRWRPHPAAHRPRRSPRLPLPADAARDRTSRSRRSTTSEIDQLGPGARTPPSPKYIGWLPTFVDYLYVSFTNSTAFSPTDTMPLTTLAKMLMMVQSAAALLTVALRRGASRQHPALSDAGCDAVAMANHGGSRADVGGRPSPRVGRRWPWTSSASTDRGHEHQAGRSVSSRMSWRSSEPGDDDGGRHAAAREAASSSSGRRRSARMWSTTARSALVGRSPAARSPGRPSAVRRPRAGRSP